MFLERLNLFFIFKTARKGSGRLTENGWKKKWRGGGGVGVVKNTKTVQMSLINDRKKKLSSMLQFEKQISKGISPTLSANVIHIFFFKLG